MGTFYNGKNEYRLEKLTSHQGHYPLCKNLEHALRMAKFRASNSGTPWTVQLWKPKRGKTVYIVKPNYLEAQSKKDLVTYFKVKGYDVSHILKKNFSLVRRRL